MGNIIILGFLLLHILSSVFTVLLIVRLIVGYRAVHDPSIKVLGNRLALGEINEEEYRHRLAILEGEIPVS